MLSILIGGMIVTALALALLWGGFWVLRQWPAFEALNSRQANKRMLQLTLILYFTGVIGTVYLMA
ncbi:hypothetical protein [Thiomicrospira sp. WB1]|uniref:hypothetical protein n=1 Tax=Thiomicrospira sp. WB1 TaxID=1685380 RepID=UPI00074ABEE2|nr:hypothetical protein [Thiomicrospira sp. WB1]KUJ72361.1 hypothetical protein AVO41_00665 [Thiomicrospira sp. WB1]